MAMGSFNSPGSQMPTAEINMTPLVDVMLVLVVIFIITAPLLASAIRLDLPKTDAAQPGDPAEVASLLRRQLPQIADRLKATLDKLQSPQREDAQAVAAELWWQRLQDRYAHAGIAWVGGQGSGQMLPGALFDSVAENLLQNALAKRQREPGLSISVAFDGVTLSVTDDGSAIAPRAGRRIASRAGALQ